MQIDIAIGDRKNQEYNTDENIEKDSIGRGKLMVDLPEVRVYDNNGKYSLITIRDGSKQLWSAEMPICELYYGYDINIRNGKDSTVEILGIEDEVLNTLTTMEAMFYVQDILVQNFDKSYKLFATVMYGKTDFSEYFSFEQLTQMKERFPDKFREVANELLQLYTDNLGISGRPDEQEVCFMAMGGVNLDIFWKDKEDVMCNSTDEFIMQNALSLMLEDYMSTPIESREMSEKMAELFSRAGLFGW